MKLEIMYILISYSLIATKPNQTNNSTMTSPLTYAAASSASVTTVSPLLELELDTNALQNNIAPGIMYNHQSIIVNANPTNPRAYPPKSVRDAVDRKEFGYGCPPSLCLPRVPLTFDPAVLIDTPLGEYGDIKLVDLSLQFDKGNVPYFICFVHFNSWATSQQAVDEMQNICNSSNRVVYPHGVGSVIQNTSVDRYLTLSGYDSYHTAEIDECFETFWDETEKHCIADEHWWELLNDESIQSELLAEQCAFEDFGEYTEADRNLEDEHWWELLHEESIHSELLIEQQEFEDSIEYTEADHAIATATSDTINWDTLCSDSYNFKSSNVETTAC
jgi:hypothetical protein